VAPTAGAGVVEADGGAEDEAAGLCKDGTADGGVTGAAADSAGGRARATTTAATPKSTIAKKHHRRRRRELNI